MIGLEERWLRQLERQEDMLGNAALGRAVTATLRVSPNGSGADGLSWRTAYQTINAALDAASTEGDDCTLILVAPHATNYDINTTGDPTWSANVVLQGAFRNWSKVMNSHATATSIMKLTGKSAVIDMNFNLGEGPLNGLILTHGGCRVRRCQFVGEDLTDGPSIALYLNHASGGKHAKVEDCDFLGGVDDMIAVGINQFGYSVFSDLRIHECAVGIGIMGANSDGNQFRNIGIGGCFVGIDIDAGNHQHFRDVLFHDNTVNVTDAVHDHIWSDIKGEFPITIEPDDMAGVTLTADAAADVWGPDTEIRAAVDSTVPFRIVAEIVEPQIAQWYHLRLSSDSGVTFFDRFMVSTARATGAFAPAGTEYIFNAGTRISGSIKAESAGSDTMQVWLKIQEV